MLFNFEESDAMCVWLKGDDVNVDVVWQHSKFEFINFPNVVENVDLFDAKNYKTQLNKDNKAFIQTSNRANWNSKLLIKGFDPKVYSSKDLLLDLDSIPKKKLFEGFAAFHNIEFSTQAWEFIHKNAKNLQELYVCITLNSCEVEMQEWGDFLSHVQEGWYKKLINNELISKAILEDDAIAIMQYILKSPYDVKKKATLQFIAANIKDGQRVWHLNNFWKNLV